MDPTLYPHQAVGVDWLLQNPRGGLFDEQGLGKTATAIVAADRAGGRVLVLAPTVVAHNWAREVATWAPCKTQVITNGRMKVDPRAAFVMCTHRLLLTEAVQDQLAAEWWDTVILDEAHFFKTPGAQRTQAFYGTVARAAERVWLLTGTPVPNDPSEVYPMLAGLAPERIRDPGTGRAMTFRRFKHHFCEVLPTRYGDRVIGAKNMPELRQRMHGFALRRRKADHLNLPAVRWGEVSITASEMPPQLQEIEEAFLGLGRHPSEFLDWLREGAQFATWRRLCGLAKAPAAADLLASDLDSGMDKVVVFVHHIEVGTEIASRLHSYGVVKITGSTSAQDRQKNVQRFQTDPRIRVAICQIVAGGTGITLTAASDVVFVELSPVPGENAQAADRCHRIGQTRSVLVRTLMLAGSVDEPISLILARKTRMIQEVLP